MNLTKIIKNKINLKNGYFFSLIIGASPSKGARSPILWNRAYNFFKKKIKMYPADISEKNLSLVCDNLKNNKYFLGSSVAVPYKVKILSYLDQIDKNAKAIGSINTIIKKKNKLLGVNTDYLGSLYSLKKLNIKKNKKEILILGCGGAGKACIVSTMNFFKNSNILIFNRDQKKLKKFIKKVGIINKNKIKCYSNLENLEKIKKLDLIINTTSIGFDSWIKNNGYYNLKNFSPLTKIKLRKINDQNIVTFNDKNDNNLKKNVLGTFNFLKRFEKPIIFDIIYQPNNTTLMKIGSLLGYKVINGLEMNFMQAVEAFKIVNNKKNIRQIMKGMNYGK